MKYRCNHCDITFESEKKEKVRCPECMGIHDVEPQNQKSGPNDKAKTKYFVPSLIVLVALAGAIIYYGVQKSKQPSDAPLQMSTNGVKDQMATLGIDMADAVVPFESTDSIKKFADTASDGKSGVDAVKAIFSKLNKLKAKGQWKSYSQMAPRNEEPLTAAELLKKIEGGDGFEATSYEITSLLLAASQSADVDRVEMVEILNYKKEKAPADPSAIYSRYAVVTEGKLFDIFAGREENEADVNLVKLDAAAATAPFYAHRGLSKFAKLDLSEALKDNQVAVELDPENATFKIHRGKIFLSSSAVQEALAEFEKAKKTRDWAVTRVALAQIYLMTQSNLTDAESAIRETLTEFPDYHQAHALLAALFMMRGDTDGALQELKIAEKIAPASPEIAATYAQLYAMQSETDKAIEYGQKAVRLSKENFQSLMILAQIYRATARFDEMRDVARKAIEKAPSEAVKDELRQLFQLTEADKEASEDADEDMTDSDKADLALDLPATPAAPAAGDLKLNLKTDSTTLGGGKLRLGSGNNRPGLGGDLKLEMNQ
ncbi:MAG: tetratricopeptide repeat protein [Deltaproteobacteria bacterium]|nr:tetratricopeptide repeat protein [Deltaproteobacteria bacterium]